MNTRSHKIAHSTSKNTQKNTRHVLRKAITTCLLVTSISSFAYSAGKKLQTVGKTSDYETGSTASYGISVIPSSIGGRPQPIRKQLPTLGEIDDSVSTLDLSDGGSQRLYDLPEIKKYMFRGSLEITPSNYNNLLQHVQTYGDAFRNFERGLYVKRWKASLSTESLLDLLLSFVNINKFTFEVEWDKSDADVSEIISRSVQFFENLTELTISGCRLNDDGMDDIIESIPSPGMITALDIRGNNLSSKTIQKIKKKFVNLSELMGESDQTVLDTFKKATIDTTRRQEQENERRRAEEERHQRELATEAERLRQKEADLKAAEKKLEEERRKVRADATEVERLKKQTTDLENQRRLEESRRVVVTQPVAPLSSVPAIARGHEDFYRRFINGKLIYRPNGDGNDTGMIAIPFLSLLNPLEGELNLSGCRDAGKYLSINIGYRKGKKAANENKLEIWIAPKFVVANDLATTATHYNDIMNKWTSPLGILWSWGEWDNLSWYDYLVDKPLEELILNNFHKNWSRARRPANASTLGVSTGQRWTHQFHATAQGHNAFKFFFNF